MRNLNPERPVSKLLFKNNSDDRISELPDGIRECILSNLTFKEAVATCVLSRRWRNCWQFVEVMNFDASDVLQRIRRFRRIASWQLTDKLLNYEQRCYADVAHQGLFNYIKSPTMESITLSFDLNYLFKDYISDIIRGALDKKTRRLQLNLTPAFPTATDRDCPEGSESWWYSYVIPMDLLAHTNIKLLTCISLKYVQVSDEAFHHLLASCPDLQSLSIKQSDILKNVSVAVAPSLEHLKISSCAFLESIHIVSAPKLVSFKFYGQETTATTDIDIKSAPLLTELGIGQDYRIINQQLLSCSRYLSRLKSLTLKYDPWHCFNDFKYNHEDIPQLPNLTHLEIHGMPKGNFSLLPYMYLMERCPKLSSFKMKKISMIHFDPLKVEEIDKPKAKHSCSTVAREIDMEALEKVGRGSLKYLKVVEFSGFIGSATDVEIAMFLLKISSDAKLVIRIAQPVDNFKLVSLEDDVTEADREIAKDCALRIAVPLGSQLVVLP